MPEIPPGGTVRNDLDLIEEPRQRAASASPCRRCNAPSWWNGWRRVLPVVRDALGRLCRLGRWLPLARCRRCKVGFTVYPPGHYPRRQYQLDVVAEVAAAVSIGGEVPRVAAEPATASATSARRWTAWVAALASAAVLWSVTLRVDPDAPAASGVQPRSRHPVHAQAAPVLSSLEALGAALVRRGVALGSSRGLGRVLEWQHREHGVVVTLVAEPRRLSTAMALSDGEEVS